MRLLLDEMLSPDIAVGLRARGHDAMGVAERSHLRGAPDEVIFELALSEGYAVVTENIGDFRGLAKEAYEAGREAPVLIFTNNQGWPRGHPRMIGWLVTALDALLSEPVSHEAEHWLH